MDKIVFLDILRQSLSGEVSSEVVEQNIKYYDQYISSRSLEDEAGVFEEIGDPRLIAKSIIESKRAAKLNGKYTGSTEKSYGYYTEDETVEENNQSTGYSRASGFNLQFTWKQRLTLILVIISIIFVLIIVGRMVIGFLFAFGVPIILILIVLALFKKRN